MIYHITNPDNWKIAQQQGFYQAPSLFIDGFIHCCEQQQVKDVINRYYNHCKDVLLLHIDEKKITAPLKYETSPSVNEQFPHIFGIINLDAVEEISALQV